MYFIIKNNIDKNGCFISGEIVDYVSSETVPEITIAKKKLENTVILLVADECGKKMSENIKIIDVHSLDQVAEPLIDCMLLYRINDNPNQIHVYHRITKQVSGYVYGQTTASEFTRINIFELIMYNGFVIPESNTVISKPTIVDIEMVQFGPSNVKIPKKMTQSPICDMISALKTSPMFLKYKGSIDK